MPATLIYDGQCLFCTRSARRLQAFAGASRLAIVPVDAPGAMDLHLDLSYSRALKAVQFVHQNGMLCEGAEAAAQAVSLRPGFAFIKYLYYMPVLRQLSDLAYAIIARNRRRCASCG